jgi:hypothetical protein
MEGGGLASGDVGQAAGKGQAVEGEGGPTVGVGFRVGDVKEHLPALLRSLPASEVAVVACHACSHLTDAIVEICISHGVDFAVMACCHRDLRVRQVQPRAQWPAPCPLVLLLFPPKRSHLRAVPNGLRPAHRSSLCPLPQHGTCLRVYPAHLSPLACVRADAGSDGNCSQESWHQGARGN